MEEHQLRNLRDFLLVYNRMTEICFQRCTSNFNYRNLTMDEERCVESCAGKLIRSNHRLMGTYVQLMPKMVQRRVDEMEAKAAENAKAAEAAAFAQTDVGPVDYNTGLKTAELDAARLDAAPAVSTFTTETEAMPSVATPIAPAAEVVIPPVVIDAGSNGPSYTVDFPQPPITGVQTEAQPAFMPSKPTSLSVDDHVPTLAAPTVSIPTESLSGLQRTPEAPPQPPPSQE